MVTIGTDGSNTVLSSQAQFTFGSYDWYPYNWKTPEYPTTTIVYPDTDAVYDRVAAVYLKPAVLATMIMSCALSF